MKLGFADEMSRYTPGMDNLITLTHIATVVAVLLTLNYLAAINKALTRLADVPSDGSADGPNSGNAAERTTDDRRKDAQTNECPNDHPLRCGHCLRLRRRRSGAARCRSMPISVSNVPTVFRSRVRPSFGRQGAMFPTPPIFRPMGRAETVQQRQRCRLCCRLESVVEAIRTASVRWATSERLLDPSRRPSCRGQCAS